MAAGMREPERLVQVRADAPQFLPDDRRLGRGRLAESGYRAGRGQRRRANEGHGRSAGAGRRGLDEARLGGSQADAELPRTPGVGIDTRARHWCFSLSEIG